MTLLDIRNQIITHLCENDTFSKDNFIEIKIDETLSSDREFIIQSVLQDLSQKNILNHVSENLWILNAPLNFSGQQINISMPVANAITETINTFLEANDIDEAKVDSLNITESNIVDLLKIIGELLNNE